MGTYKGDVSVEAAWDALKADAQAVLIDVRSQAEWTFVGGPDLSALGREPVRIEWQRFPGMVRNEQFLKQLLDQGLDKAQPLYFLCRSGVRSHHAAQLAAEQGFTTYNVAKGFEGNLNGQAQRGQMDGWKHAGLPWKQS